MARLRARTIPAPLLVNIIIDILIALFAIFGAIPGLNFISLDGNCYYGDFPLGDCYKYGLGVRILVGVALGFAVLDG